MKWENLYRLPPNLPFILNTSNLEWGAHWHIVHSYSRRWEIGAEQFMVAVEQPLRPLNPVFILCPVIIAANQFNLGSEADVLMRMERCWMIPPGHYWWLTITHATNRGTRDSWDAHSGTSRCYHCAFICVYNLYTGLCVCTHILSVCRWRAQLPLPPLTSLCSASKEGFLLAVFSWTALLHVFLAFFCVHIQLNLCLLVWWCNYFLKLFFRPSAFIM